MHKAILIKPSELLVTNIEVGEHYTEIQNTIGCRCFTMIRIDEKNVAYLDDEGLINGTEFGTKFNDDIYPQTLAGNILIIGDDGMGGSCDTTATLKSVQQMISHFVRLSEFHHKQ